MTNQMPADHDDTVPAQSCPCHQCKAAVAEVNKALRASLVVTDPKASYTSEIWKRPTSNTREG